MKQADILIKNACIYTQDAARSVLSDSDIAIKDGRIAAIGKLQDMWQAAESIDASGKTVFPGFQNLHVHSFQSLYKGLGADLPLIAWLQKTSLWGGPRMTPELEELAVQIACMESLKSGVTTFSDFNYVQINDEIPRAIIEAMEKTGIRGVYMDTYHETGEDYGVVDGYRYPADECIRRTEKLLDDYKPEEHPMIQIMPGTCVPWATTPRFYFALAEFAKDRDLPVTMHCLETPEDNENHQRLYGKSVVQLCDELGFLSDRLIAVHCVYLTEEEIKLFAERGVHIVYCPAANCYLGSGIAPIASALHAGVNITMGTDGAASNNCSDMIESMKLGLFLQKASCRQADIMTAQDMLDAVTVNPARALRRNDTGSIETGKAADMFIFNTDDYVWSSPCFDPLATLMYSASQQNVETTIVNGRVLYDHGVFRNGLDEKTIANKANSVMRKFLKDENYIF